MGFELGDWVDKIQGYSNVLNIFQFKNKGDGKKPWSFKHENEKGHIIEIRNSEWSSYENGKEIVGHNPNELKIHLLKQLSKDELIDLIMG